MFDPGTLRVTYVNRGGADLVGLDATEVEEQTITALIASSDEAGFRQRLADLRASSNRGLKYTDVLARRGDRQIPVDALLQEVVLPGDVDRVEQQGLEPLVALAQRELGDLLVGDVARRERDAGPPPCRGPTPRPAMTPAGRRTRCGWSARALTGTRSTLWPIRSALTT